MTAALSDFDLIIVQLQWPGAPYQKIIFFSFFLEK